MAQKTGESLSNLIDREKKICNDLHEALGFYLGAVKEESRARERAIERFRQFQVKWAEYREIRKKFE